MGTLTLSLVLVLIAFFNFKSVRQDESMTPYKTAVVICAHLSHHFGTATVLTTYYILTYYLSERFEVLNALLRFDSL